MTELFFSQNKLGYGLVMDAQTGKPLSRKPVVCHWQLVQFDHCDLRLFVKVFSMSSMDGSLYGLDIAPLLNQSHGPRELLFSLSVFGYCEMVYGCKMLYISKQSAREHLDYAWLVMKSILEHHCTNILFLKALFPLFSLESTSIIHGLIDPIIAVSQSIEFTNITHGPIIDPLSISHSLQVTELFFNQNVFGYGLVMDAHTGKALPRKRFWQLVDNGLFDHCRLSFFMNVFFMNGSLHGLDTLLHRSNGPRDTKELLFSQSVFGYGAMVYGCTMFSSNKTLGRKHLDFPLWAWLVGKSILEHHTINTALLSLQCPNVIHDPVGPIIAISQSVECTNLVLGPNILPLTIICQSVEMIELIFSHNVFVSGLVMDAQTGKPSSWKHVNSHWRLSLFDHCKLSLFLKVFSMDGCLHGLDIAPILNRSHSPRETAVLLFSPSVFGYDVMVYGWTILHISKPSAREHFEFSLICAWSVGNSVLEHQHTNVFLKPLFLLQCTNVIHNLIGPIIAVNQSVESLKVVLGQIIVPLTICPSEEMIELFFSHNVFVYGLVMDAQTGKPLSRKPVNSLWQLVKNGLFDHCNLSFFLKVFSMRCMDGCLHVLDIAPLLNRSHGPRETTELFFSQSVLGYDVIVYGCTWLQISKPSAREHLDFSLIYAWSVGNSVLEHHHTKVFLKALFSLQSTNVIHNLIGLIIAVCRSIESTNIVNGPIIISLSISPSLQVTELFFCQNVIGYGLVMDIQTGEPLPRKPVDSLWQSVEKGLFDHCHLSLIVNEFSVYSIEGPLHELDITPPLNRSHGQKEMKELHFSRSVFGYGVRVYCYTVYHIIKPSARVLFDFSLHVWLTMKSITLLEHHHTNSTLKELPFFFATVYKCNS